MIDFSALDLRDLSARVLSLARIPSVWKALIIQRVRSTLRLMFETLRTSAILRFGGNGVVAAPGSQDFANAAAFGKITSTRDLQNDQREIQFALKFYF